MVRTLAKPAGLPVFPPHDDPGGDCLLARLLAEEPERAELAWPRGFEGGIAHRLDTPTSGAVLVAGDPSELAWLRAWFADGRLTKVYRLVVAREPAWDENRCDRPIAHDPRRKARMVVQRGASTPHRGRWYEAHTRFRRLRGPLFEATITTGVMHQIRVHAAFLGIPLLGDRIYGGGAGTFCLHHVGATGPGGFRSDPVAHPEWAHAT